MGRPRDEDSWNEVIKEDDGTLTCKRCRKKFKGGVARIKAHLGEEKGKGIKLCEGRRALDNEGVDNSIIPGPSNPPDVVNGPSSLKVATVRHAYHVIDDNMTHTSNHQNVTYPTNFCEEVGGDPMIDSSFDGSMNHQNDAGPSNIVEETGLAHVEDAVGSGNSGLESDEIKESVEYLSWKEDCIKERLLPWLEYIGNKRKREKVDDWLEKVGDLKKRACEMIDSRRQGRLTYLQKEIEDLLQEPEEFSDESGDFCFERMRELLRNDEVFFIGVYGMGGAGKTWLVTHFKNQITSKGTFNFENVFWVTVSQDFSILKLQNRIANRIGIKLDDDDGITERAEILSSALEKKDRSVLILDDVWNYIDLQKVGIPLRANGIKLILTSRLEYVFHQMDCPADNITRMKPYLDHEDAWGLFLLKLGCHGIPAALATDVQNIARSIVKKCDGLPLGIRVMARTMKGVYGIHQWRHALNKLENSAMGEEIEEDVIKVLKLSYDHLMDDNIRNCFLQCALYNRISAEEFIMNLVDEGLIKAKGSLEEIFDEGRAILDKLNGHSLLLKMECKNVHGIEIQTDDLKMHGLVRDMVSHIMKGRYMVKCNKGLKKTPNMQEWAPYLEKVSLMDNNIEEIPEGTSPRCSQLSTFIFNHNRVKYFPGCFFNYTNALTVLNLSYNEKLASLPSSLSTLRSLKSLLLKSCDSLLHVPPLGELQELSRLVISKTSIEQVPEGLAMLVKLNWLDLSGNTKLTSVPGSVLFSLTNMQYLDIYPAYVTVTEEVENMQGMNMVEYFSGGFQVGKNLGHYVENIMGRGSGPKYYHIFLGIDYDFGRLLVFRGEFSCDGDGALTFFGKDREDRHCVNIGDCEALDHLLLPRELHRLRISRNKQWSGGICDALSFEAPSSLRRIRVEYCPKLERLLCLSGSCSFCEHLQNLQSLSLYGLERLEDVIWKENDEGICLPKLSDLKIRFCQRMEKLLTPLSLRQLPNLETIEVTHCGSMKEIFAVRSSKDDNIDSTITLCFSKLSHLKIWGCGGMEKLLTPLSLQQLPNLETIEVTHCSSMEEIFAVRSSEDDNIDSTITLPNSFKKLRLSYLPELKSVCKKIIVFGSARTLEVRDCPNLRVDSLRHKSSHSDSEPVVLSLADSI